MPRDRFNEALKHTLCLYDVGKKGGKPTKPKKVEFDFSQGSADHKLTPGRRYAIAHQGHGIFAGNRGYIVNKFQGLHPDCEFFFAREKMPAIDEGKAPTAQQIWAADQELGNPEAPVDRPSVVTTPNIPSDTDASDTAEEPSE